MLPDEATLGRCSLSCHVPLCGGCVLRCLLRLEQVLTLLLVSVASFLISDSSAALQKKINPCHLAFLRFRSVINSCELPGSFSTNVLRATVW